MTTFFAFNQMSPYNDTPYAGLMVDSIRKHMPSAQIQQISDKTAKCIRGVEHQFKMLIDYDKDRYPRDWFSMLYAMYSVLDVGDNPFVHCDADIFFGGDVTSVLCDEYDIAICRRPANGDDDTGNLYRIFHPYNIGFMVFKNPLVVKACNSVINADGLPLRSWDLGQHVVGLVVNSGEFKVKLLDSNIYNRTPKSVDDFDESVKVWHFKGDRKNWMPEWVSKHYG